jgi:replicative DNA helicase
MPSLMSKPHERIPPQNLEAEQSLLGSLLVDPDAIIKVADVVRADDFYRESHGKIFEAIIQLFERHDPIDILSLGNRLEEQGLAQRVGGRAYLVELSNIVPTSANAKHYAEIVQKKATLRRLLNAAAEITRIGYDEDEDVESSLDQAERVLFGVSEKLNKNSFVPIRTVLHGAFDRIDELHRDHGKLRGVSTGFKELDALLAGLQKSDLIILAARPSVGKTSLALDICRSIGVNSKEPVGFFSLEMSKEQLVDRMICAQANVDLWKLRTGRLSDRDDDFPRIGQALGELSEAPIYIDDAAGLNIMQLRTKARRLKTEHGLSAIVVDYLQLMEGRSKSGSENRVQEVSEISRGLKMIAKELDIPVLALAQLSRAVESIKPSIPRLSHLRDSGSIEQDADVVMFIYRKAVDKNFRPEDVAPEEANIAEVYIAKHRNGPTGMVRLFFDKKRASFLNLEDGSRSMTHKASNQNSGGFAPFASPQDAVAPPAPPMDRNPGAAPKPVPPVDQTPGVSA